MTEEQITRPRSRLRMVVSLFMRLVLIVTVLLMLAAIAAGVGGFLIYEEVTRDSVAGNDVEVDIPPGASGGDVGELLTDAGLLRHPILLRIAIRIDDSSETIKHGPYVLHDGMSPSAILDQLQEGPNRKLLPGDIPDELKKTIPEGLRLTQIADLFDDPDAFLEAALDPALLERLDLERATPEGFLMPSTYFFDAPPTPADVVERMADQFLETYAKLLEEIPEAAELDRLEIVTIASLVEEEARLDEERAIVASVIYNRLARDRTLDFDSTLQYALNKYGQRLLNEDKEVDSPYNTYRNRGLPPGPISNPGAASLRAAMNPAETEYLYFVSNADGKSHTFSKTLAEHNEAVARYRREIREQRRAEQ